MTEGEWNPPTPNVTSNSLALERARGFVRLCKTRLGEYEWSTIRSLVEKGRRKAGYNTVIRAFDTMNDPLAETTIEILLFIVIMGLAFLMSYLTAGGW